MQPTLWLQEARWRLAGLAQTIEDWAPSTIYGAIAGATLLPLAATSGDPKEILAGLISGIGANLVANQLEAWGARNDSDETALAKQLSEAAKADAKLRDSLDELLRRIGALEVVIYNTAESEQAATVQTLARQFAKLNSGLDVEQIYVGRDWITTGNISNAHNVIVGSGNTQTYTHIETQVIQQAPLDPSLPNPAHLRTAYLNRLYSQADTLSLTGVDPKAASGEARLSLGAVYTALLTMTPEHHERWQTGERPAREVERLSAVDQLNRHQLLVLLGDPGSGKSTFVNFVALCLAGEALGKAANLKLLTEPLPSVEEEARDQEGKKKRRKRQPWKRKALLPVRVILRDFAARGLPPSGRQATADHLWQFICSELGSGPLAEYPPHLRNELQGQGGLLLLDGLDEVPDADQRRSQIKVAVEDFVALFPRCRVLVTSRTYAYQQQEWRLRGFTETVLAPFSDSQIRHFIDRWYAHIAEVRALAQTDAQGRAELLKRAIFASARLHELAERPLLLTLTASLHAWRGGTLPERREELYDAAVNLLLDWWESQRVVRDEMGKLLVVQPSLVEWLKVDREAVRRVLNELAYTAHARQLQLVGTADIAEKDLVYALYALRQNPDVSVEKLIQYLSERAGLLVPRGVKVYTFPHRTFQEYLAACHLTDVDYPDHLADLARREPNRWREVALLAGAKAVRGTASAIWSLVAALCYRQPRETDYTLDDVWGAHLAGQALVESATLDHLTAHNRKRVERVRDCLLHAMRYTEFPAIERAAAGRTLSVLGDPRFRTDAWYLPDDPLLGFVEMAAGKFIMGSDKRKDKEAEDDETPQHEVNLPAFYIARYPVTVAQFRAFVEATGQQLKYDYGWAYPDNHPMCYITWHEATRYCAWLTKTLRAWDKTPKLLADKLAQGWQFMLPSEAEWERAARGLSPSTGSGDGDAAALELVEGTASTGSETGRRYPWGNEPVDPNRANYDETGINTTSAVGCFPAGATPEGVEELAGNVWEWTRSRYMEYPYPSDEAGRREREWFEAKDSDRFVQRGGSAYNSVSYVRAPVRDDFRADLIYSDFGLRVVCGAAPWL